MIYKSVAEIADEFDVTVPAVHYWISKGLTHKTEKVMGRRERIVIDSDDVRAFLNLGIREGTKPCG